MKTEYQCKVDAVCDCIQTTVSCLPYADDRAAGLAAASRNIRRIAGEQGIYSDELAAGIEMAVRYNVITGKEGGAL